MIIALYFFGAFVCLAFAAALAAVHIALTTVSHREVADADERGARGAATVVRVLADIPTHVHVLTYVRGVLEALATVFIAMAFNEVFDASWQMVVLTVLSASIAVFVIAGVSPRNIGRRFPLGTSLALGGLASGLRRALGPVALVLVWLGNMLTPASVTRDTQLVTEGQLRDLVDRATASDIIDAEERDMIENVFGLSETRVWKVMVPRTDLVTVEAGTPLRKAMTLFLRSGFSRVPVSGEDLDDIRGLLYLKDIARLLHRSPELGDAPVEDYAREASFVPDTKAIDDLLREMQLKSAHVSVVVDEYGGTAGIVTIEDIVEEIVGEIDDEYDSAETEAVEVSDGVMRVSARMQIDDLAELFDVRIDDEDVSTVGGLLAKAVGRVPIGGSHADVAGLRLEAEPGLGRRHRIENLLVSRVQETAEHEGSPA